MMAELGMAAAIATAVITMCETRVVLMLIATLAVMVIGWTLAP